MNQGVQKGIDIDDPFGTFWIMSEKRLQTPANIKIGVRPKTKAAFDSFADADGRKLVDVAAASIAAFGGLPASQRMKLYKSVCLPRRGSVSTA